MPTSVLCLAALVALCGAAAGSPVSPEAHAPPLRRLFQGLGQAPVTAGTEIPPATCSRPGPFSFFVSLKDGNGEHLCGGILINDGVNKLSQWVLTSAHCVDDISNPDAIFNPVVDISGRKRDEPIEELETDMTIIHPDWSGDRSQGNDIALLKLVNTSCYRFPVNVAEPDFVLPEDGEIQFIAFGREASDSGFSDQLQAGIWRVVEREECEDNYLQDGTELMDSMMCSRGQNVVGLCQGDEGGPLVWAPDIQSPEGRNPFTKRVIGIASFSDVDDCQSPDGVALFTSISKVNQWVNETIMEFSQ